MSAIRTNLVVEAAARLGTLIDVHARDAGRQLGDLLLPCLQEGETPPDFTLVLQLPARRIRQAGQRLRQSRDELDEAGSRESEARFRRDRTASALRLKLVEIRRLLTSALGPRRTATLLGIGGKTAQGSQHALLLKQAGAFASLLRDPRRLAIPPAERYFDPAVVAGALEPLAADLREACGQLDEIRGSNAARHAATRRARRELVLDLRCVIRLLGGWLRLISRDDLAEKLRPIQRLIRGRRQIREPRRGGGV